MSPNEKQQRPSGAHTRPESKGRREKGQEAGKKRVARVIYVLLTILAAVIVGVFLFLRVFTAPPDTSDLPTRKPQTTTVVDQFGNEMEVEGPALPSDRKREFYTFLLIGQDTYGGGNTDTMMLAAYDVPHQRLSVMSLPRDTFVEFNGRRVLLNSVYNRAGGGERGVSALKEEVGELTGVTPDYHVIVQWEAVGTLVDAIGGVYFDVPRRMYYNDLSQNFKIDLQKGYQLMDGKKAMQLIRWRHNSDDSGHILNSGYATGDLGRIQTQQEFMKAIIAKCLQPEVLLDNLNDYLKIFQENVKTDLTLSNLAYFAKSAVGRLSMDHVETLTLPNKPAGDGAHVLPAADELLEEVNKGFNPYLEDIRLGELHLVTEGGKRPSKPSPSVKPKPTEKPTQPPAPTTPAVVPTPSGSVPPTAAPSTKPSEVPTPHTPAPSVAPEPPTQVPTQPPATQPPAPPVDEQTPAPVPEGAGGASGPGMAPEE